jgi:hypothetical protein
MSQRVSLASEQLKLAQAQPQMHNIYEAYRRMYSALGVDNIEQILTPPQQPQPTNAITENGQLQMALVGKQQLKAFPQQNHDAHIKSHLAFMNSPVVRGNPAAMQILQAHIFEHLSLKAQTVAQQEMQQMQQQGQQIPPEMMQMRVDEIEAELMVAYLQEEAQLMGMQKQDPLVELKQQELMLRQQDQMQDARQEQMELEFNKQKANEQASIQRERIGSTEDIAAMRAQIALQRTANRRN